ncbi:hypothetical protein [Methanosarcina sp. MSH10X1]|uniref:hypothetical protein n=1 Tax=Methanosarcina sp. MSH10X1 TaxID=2507075 RepID=UPI0013E2D561|nr:hypothetical protein [Methanosarcina sp. MSH10X1]
MDYIKKVCPACGSEFIVLKNREGKAVYCTLHCLSKSQADSGRNIVSPLMPA